MTTLKNKNLLLILILLFSFAIRLYRLSDSPPSPYIDEIDVGYQAYSILTTGKDYFGNTLPLAIHSFADHRAPLLIYTDIPFVAIFGLNSLAVRLPSVLFSTLSILGFYLLLNELFHDEKISLFGAFLLSVTPWHYHYSRIAFESSLLLFLFIFGFYFALKSLKSRSYLVPTAVFWALMLFTYNTAKFFIPIFGGIWVLENRNILFSKIDKNIFLAIFISLLASILVLISTFSQRGGMRFKEIAIYTDPTVKSEVNLLREEAASARNGGKRLGLSPNIEEKIFYNKPKLWIHKFTTNYISSLSTQFLFDTGDPNLRHSQNGWGELYKITFPLIIIGIVYLFTQKFFKKKRLIVFWILLAPIAASITRDGGMHATRLFLLLPALVMIASVGFNKISSVISIKSSKFLKTIIFISILFTAANYFYDYFFLYPQTSQKVWMHGIEKAVKLANASKNNYDEVVLDAYTDPPLIAYLFYSSYDPKEFYSMHPLPLSHLENGMEGFQIDNIFMLNPGTRNWRSSPPPFSGDFKALIITHANQLDENLIEHPNSLPAKTILKDIVFDLQGNPEYYILEFQSFAPTISNNLVN